MWCVKLASKIQGDRVNYLTFRALSMAGRTPANRVEPSWGPFEGDRIAGLDGWKNGVKVGKLKGEERIRVMCKWHGVLGDIGEDNIFHFTKDSSKFSYGVFGRLFGLYLNRRQGIPFVTHIYGWRPTSDEIQKEVWLHPSLQFDVKTKGFLNAKPKPGKTYDEEKRLQIRKRARDIYVQFLPLYAFYQNKPSWGHGYTLLDSLENPDTVNVTKEFIGQLKYRWKTAASLQRAFRNRMYVKHEVITYKEAEQNDDKNDTEVNG